MSRLDYPQNRIALCLAIQIWAGTNQIVILAEWKAEILTYKDRDAILILIIAQDKFRREETLDTIRVLHILRNAVNMDLNRDHLGKVVDLGLDQTENSAMFLVK